MYIVIYQTIIQQLIASWSPPEWIEIRVDYDVGTDRLRMHVDEFRLHVTYSKGGPFGGSMEVKRIHSPYKNDTFNLRRAEELEQNTRSTEDSEGAEKGEAL